MVECRTWTAEASGSSPDTLTKYLTCRGGVIAAQGSPKPLARERNLVPMPINEEVCRNGYCGVCKTFLCRFESDLPLQYYLYTGTPAGCWRLGGHLPGRIGCIRVEIMIT